MKSLSQYLAHRSAKEDACHFNGKTLNLTHFAQLAESAKDGTTFYIATEKTLFGKKGVDFVSTREKTTSHGRWTPKGSKAETAYRLKVTLEQMFAGDQYYGPEVEKHRAYLMARIADQREVTKDPEFMQALKSVAQARPMTPPAAKTLGPFAEKLHIAGIGPTTTAKELVQAITPYPLAVKERMADQLRYHIHQNIKIDPDTKKPVSPPIVGLLVQVLDETLDLIDSEKHVSVPVSADADPQVGSEPTVDATSPIGAFAVALKNVSVFKAGYQLFGEIDDSTTVGELVENVQSRFPETQEVIKGALSLIVRESEDPWNITMASHVLSSMANDASDPYEDIDDPADFFQPNAPVEWKGSDLNNPYATQGVLVDGLNYKVPLRQWALQNGQGASSPVPAKAAVPSITTTIPLDPEDLSGESSSDDDSSIVDSH